MNQSLSVARAACGIVLVAAGCLTAGPVMGQSAYYSLVGDFNVAADQHDLLFGLSRSVGSGETHAMASPNRS